MDLLHSTASEHPTVSLGLKEALKDASEVKYCLRRSGVDLGAPTIDKSPSTEAKPQCEVTLQMISTLSIYLSAPLE